MRENVNSEDNLIDKLSDNESDYYIDTEMMDSMLRETFEGVFEDSQKESIEVSQNAELGIVNDPIHSPAQKIWRYPITVSIGLAQVSEEDMVSLKEDDLIPLDQAFDLPIILKTSEGKSFKGTLGKVRGRYAIRLS